MRNVWIGSTLAAVTLLAGCGHALRDGWNDLCVSVRNHRHADAAWDRAESLYEHVPYGGHFEEGFEAGYIAVAQGDDGCPPTLPPRRYWKARYRSPEGHQKARAWFDGYAHGAIAAEHDGIAHWNRIPVSPAAMPTNSPPPLDWSDASPLLPTPQLPDAPEPMLVPPAPPVASPLSPTE